MNSDDFEQKLQRQPIRPIPAEWQRDILRNAEVSAAQASDNTPLKTWLHQLLWPCPQAWAGLAAIWIFMLFLHLNTSESPQFAGRQNSASPSQLLMALLDQKNQLLVESEESRPRKKTPQPPKAFVPRPHTELVDLIITV